MYNAYDLEIKGRGSSECLFKKLVLSAHSLVFFFDFFDFLTKLSFSEEALK